MVTWLLLWCVNSPWWWLLVSKSKHLALKSHDSISRDLVDSRPWSSQLTNFHQSWKSRLQVICLLLPRRETSLNFQNNRFGPHRSEFERILGPLVPYNSSPNDKINRLTPNDHYRGRTAPLTSKRWILNIYSTNIGTAYFKHGIYSPFF